MIWSVQRSFGRQRQNKILDNGVGGFISSRHARRKIASGQSQTFSTWKVRSMKVAGHTLYGRPIPTKAPCLHKKLYYTGYIILVND
jgi:hypothetical protein